MVDLARLREAVLPNPGARVVSEPDPGEGGHLVPAAVLVPVVTHPVPTVLLTLRTAHLRDHAGQVSFPGGRVDADDGSAEHTALREAAEEIGLAPAAVEIIGYLPEYRTVTGFRITPVVGLVAPGQAFTCDPFEVSELFEVPLSFVLDPQNHRQHQIHYRGRLREYTAVTFGDYLIWGATAGMLCSLADLLNAPAGR
jgi:8-oxo-dGTP pyrophosphatase MutT (NUDIX family)